MKLTFPSKAPPLPGLPGLTVVCLLHLGGSPGRLRAGDRSAYWSLMRSRLVPEPLGACCGGGGAGWWLLGMQEQRPGGLGVMNAVWGEWLGSGCVMYPPCLPPGVRREELHELLGRFVCPPRKCGSPCRSCKCSPETSATLHFCAQFSMEGENLGPSSSSCPIPFSYTHTHTHTHTALPADDA